ncbi:hypothetical protein STINGER_94 [Mycobacterium phage Stinger]|uniref:Uncharacterized protein n=1 Tax=Mycobacterium phage Stinger TaxID=1089137 RepID=G8I9L5_9CAUD|nr:hypothetical protein STINGER_94 [Mycobacterium phage Stinger]AER49408.1 hypothetical protein STINGER_94 [Mycobacterium phage Stinger]
MSTKPANGLPTAPVISRALHRDFGIICQPIHRAGYSAHRGNGRTIPANVWVSVSDLDSANVRKAKQLADDMIAVGYQVDLAPGSSIIYVRSVPSAKDAAAAIARIQSEEA